MSKSYGWGGILLVAAGVLSIVVNAILVPMLPNELPFPGVMASQVYLIRLSLAIPLMLCLTISIYCLYRSSFTSFSLVGWLFFMLAFLGNIALFAHEWAQVFYIYPLANIAPEGLIAMENVEGFDLYDLEAALAAGLSSLGWICFSVILIIRKTYGRLAPSLVIAGYVLIIVLSIMLPQPYGGAIGSILLSFGWIKLGLKLREVERSSHGQQSIQ